LKRIGKTIVVIVIILIILRGIIYNSSAYYINNPYIPIAGHLNKHDLTLIKGEEFRLFYYGLNKRVSFSSSDFRIIGVDFLGRIYAYQTGKAYVKVNVDNKLLKCRVRVIDINYKSLRLNKGNSKRLHIQGYNGIVKWNSSNKDVVKINAFGKIKCLNKGRSTISANVKGKKLKCKIYVR